MQTDSSFLDSILYSHLPRLDQVHAIHHLTEFIIELGIQGDLETFTKVLKRKELVDWNNPSKSLLDYTNHLLGLGDISDIIIVILRRPPLNTLEYNDIHPEIRDAFVNFILENSHRLHPNQQPSHSHAVLICTFVSNYLSFQNQGEKLNTFLQNVHVKGSKIILEGPLNFAIVKNYIEIIHILVDGNYLDQLAYDAGLRHVCIRGSEDAFKAFIQGTNYLKLRTEFDFEIGFSVFHNRQFILDHLVNDPLIAPKISAKTRKRAIEALASQNYNDYFVSDIQLVRNLLLIAARVYDNTFINYIFSKMELDDIAVVAIASYSSFFGNFEMIQFFFTDKKFNNYRRKDEFISEVLTGACMGNQIKILNYLHYGKAIKSSEIARPGFVSSIESGNWQIISFFLKEYSHYFQPIDVFLHLILHRNSYSTRVLTSLLDMGRINVSSEIISSYLDMGRTILFLAKNDLRSLQLLIDNVYTQALFTNEHVIQILDAILQDENPQLLEFILSKHYLMDVLKLDQFNNFEQDVYKRRLHSLKKVLSRRGRLVYRLHSSSLSSTLLINKVI